MLVGCQIQEKPANADSVVATIELPSDRYPETAKHIKEAIQKGETDTCTIDRKGAEKRREGSLKGIPTKKGYDRDEFPMALCSEGGKGADIKYVSPKDNRGAGSYIGNKLERYKDGQRVRISVR
nr:NucA/NucB deoxyribonuclease domain-containing protein [Thermoactinomyces sp. DSM 45892]